MSTLSYASIRDLHSKSNYTQFEFTLYCFKLPWNPGSTYTIIEPGECIVKFDQQSAPKFYYHGSTKACYTIKNGYWFFTSLKEAELEFTKILKETKEHFERLREELDACLEVIDLQ